VARGLRPPLARDRTVAVLGLGVLGAACAQALAALNFRARLVALAQIHRRASPPTGRMASTPRCKAEIVVLLLPDTPGDGKHAERRTLSLLPQGAVIINPGRGP
jgi:glyoxylate/hydroxypyruvate reductase A